MEQFFKISNIFVNRWIQQKDKFAQQFLRKKIEQNLISLKEKEQINSELLKDIDIIKKLLKRSEKIWANSKGKFKQYWKGESIAKFWKRLRIKNERIS